MTKRDYERIAEAVRSVSDKPGHVIDRGTVALVADALADRLAADNPRFARTTFLRACGFEG